MHSKDGAEGVSLTNPPREQYLDKILKQLVIPFFVGQDARELENLLWELYRCKDNYKLYGLALWSPQAWMEFAILDMLGRIAGKPMGALLGDVLRQDVPIYVASGRRDTTPEEEVEYLQELVQQSGAKAVKFRVGGRMSRNEDAMPGRTDKLIPLVRRAGVQRLALPVDDPQPRRGHRPARPPLLRRDDPVDPGGADGRLREDADDSGSRKWRGC